MADNMTVLCSPNHKLSFSVYIAEIQSVTLMEIIITMTIIILILTIIILISNNNNAVCNYGNNNGKGDNVDDDRTFTVVHINNEML